MKSLTEQINRRSWWHSPPVDKLAYKKRGIFLASSFKECEFYGRPLDEPIKVQVSNPLIGVEKNIIKILYGIGSDQMKAHNSLINDTAKDTLNVRFHLDADIFTAAKKKGFDSIAIVTENGLEKIKEGKLPRSVELNVFNINDVKRASRAASMTCRTSSGSSNQENLTPPSRALHTV